jgi:hypothetical protein
LRAPNLLTASDHQGPRSFPPKSPSGRHECHKIMIICCQSIGTLRLLILLNMGRSRTDKADVSGSSLVRPTRSVLLQLTPEQSRLEYPRRRQRSVRMLIICPAGAAQRTSGPGDSRRVHGGVGRHRHQHDVCGIRTIAP